jgi:hypothetical protein
MSFMPFGFFYLFFITATSGLRSGFPMGAARLSANGDKLCYHGLLSSSFFVRWFEMADGETGGKLADYASGPWDESSTS